MKYADLIAPDNLAYSEQVFNQKTDETLTIRRAFFDWSYFIGFLPKQWQNKHPQSVHTNWKARLSIHPQDLDKAWELIYPILHEHGISFKVANRNIFQKRIADRLAKLDELLRYKAGIDSNAKSVTHLSLRKAYAEVSQRLNAPSSKWKLIALIQSCYSKLSNFLVGLFSNKHQLLALIKQKYEQLIAKTRQQVTSGLRFYEGMQFTIYIVPGDESKCQMVLKEIESLLIAENIRPGEIYPTDRQIGIYSSIRHPGKTTYHYAISVDSYNPDNVKDPFEFLETLPADEVIHEHDCIDCSTQNIINTLITKKFISPQALKIFAKHKEEVVAHIQSQSRDIQKQFITDSLNHSTNLGRFFRVQRGFLKPKSGRGTLKQIENLDKSLGLQAN